MTIFALLTMRTLKTTRVETTDPKATRSPRKSPKKRAQEKEGRKRWIKNLEFIENSANLIPVKKTDENDTKTLNKSAGICKWMYDCVANISNKKNLADVSRIFTLVRSLYLAQPDNIGAKKTSLTKLE